MWEVDLLSGALPRAGGTVARRPQQPTPRTHTHENHAAVYCKSHKRYGCFHDLIFALSRLRYVSCYMLQLMAVYVDRTSCYVTLRIPYWYYTCSNTLSTINEWRRHAVPESKQAWSCYILSYQSQHRPLYTRCLDQDSGQLSQLIYTEIQKAATVLQIVWHLTWSI